MKNTQKRKKTPKSQKTLPRLVFFLQNRKKPETKIFVFSVITFEPIEIKTC